MKKKFELRRFYTVKDYEDNVDEKILRRLLELGFTKGTKFCLSHKSLLGKSVIVELRGYDLSMRVDFLNMLKVE